MPRLEVAQALQLRLLFLFGRADQFDLLRCAIHMRVAEGVDADDRVGAVVLLVLVVHRLFLDLAALVAGLHRPQNPAALGDRLELFQHRLFHQVGELVDDEGALVRVLVLRQAPLAVDDELDRYRAAHRLLGGRGDGLVVSIRMQAIRIVVGRDQRLQPGADVVERKLADRVRPGLGDVIGKSFSLSLIVQLAVGLRLSSARSLRSLRNRPWIVNVLSEVICCDFARILMKWVNQIIGLDRHNSGWHI